MLRDAPGAASTPPVGGRTLSGPWGADELDGVAAVVIDDDGAGGRRWSLVSVELADAINRRHIASFNLFLSLAPAERALLAPLYAEER